MDTPRILHITIPVAVDEHGLGTQFVRGAQRHRGMNPELPRSVRCGGHNPTLIRAAAHNYGFAFERWIEQLFDRNEECVHVQVEEGASHRLKPVPLGLRAVITRGRPARSVRMAISVHFPWASIALTGS